MLSCCLCHLLQWYKRRCWIPSTVFVCLLVAWPSNHVTPDNRTSLGEEGSSLVLFNVFPGLLSVALSGWLCFYAFVICYVCSVPLGVVFGIALLARILLCFNASMTSPKLMLLANRSLHSPHASHLKASHRHSVFPRQLTLHPCGAECNPRFSNVKGAQNLPHMTAARCL